MDVRSAREVDDVVPAVPCRANETVEHNAVGVVVEPEPAS